MALNLRRESVRSKVRVLDQGEMVADVTFRALDLGRKVGRSEVQGHGLPTCHLLYTSPGP